MAPIHDAWDGARVEHYEAQIRAGQRPVALALCLGMPFGVYGADGTFGLCGWGYGEREVASLRAILDSADAAEPAKASIRAYLAEAEVEGRERHGLTPEGFARTAREREEALSSGAASGMRLGLCVILDGHHKMKAAANLGAACTVLCYGLQGTVVTGQRVPHDMEGDAPNMYLDAEAIYEAVAPSE